jgi:hypothetical protein
MPATATGQKVISVRQRIHHRPYQNGNDPEALSRLRALLDGIRIPIVEVFNIADEEPLLLTFRMMDGLRPISFGEVSAIVGRKDILTRGHRATFALWSKGVGR